MLVNADLNPADLNNKQVRIERTIRGQRVFLQGRIAEPRRIEDLGRGRGSSAGVTGIGCVLHEAPGVGSYLFLEDGDAVVTIL